jgi:hypothetical protein
MGVILVCAFYIALFAILGSFRETADPCASTLAKRGV